MTKKILTVTIFILYSLHLFPLSDRDIKIQAKAKLSSGTTFELEVVRSVEDRLKGLMFRERMNYYRGMLFIFENSDFHSFHMLNTYLRLDLIWLNTDYKIVYFYKDVPPCKNKPCPSYTPFAKGRFVIEFNSGVIKKENLKIGDIIDVEFIK